MTFMCVIAAVMIQDADSEAEPVTGRGSERSVRFVEGRTVRLAAAAPRGQGEALVSCVVLPEKELGSIVAAWDEEAISLEHAGGRLFVRLLARRSGHVDVIGASGRHYRIFVSAAEVGQEWDETLAVIAPEERKQRRAAALDLIVAMRRGEEIEGGHVRRWSGEEIDVDSGARMQVRFVYSLDGMTGYIVQVANKSEKEMPLDPARFKAEGLLLVGVSRSVIAPGGEGVLYLVFAEGQR